MTNIFKYILFLIIITVPMRSFALELDLSVDEEIRKNYSPTDLEIKQLPQLPNIDKTTIPKASSNTTTQQTVPKVNLTPIPTTGLHRVKNMPGTSNTKSTIDASTAIKLKKGTKFRVKSLTTISDRNRAGARMSFTLLEPVTRRYITIPAGATIKGVITDSHIPQRTGNGGLIVVKIDSLVFNGTQKSLTGKVTKANSKKIFFNNIKGKRKYLTSIPKYAKKGKPFYQKMMKTTSKLSQNPVGWILTPFTVISGVAVYGTTIIASPISAGFSKGDSISIPAGTIYELKLTEEAYME